MNHFAYMGDQAGDEAPIRKWNPLTDALYGVRYYMDIKDLEPAEKEAHPLRECISLFCQPF